jgi:hypothetical protein
MTSLLLFQFGSGVYDLISKCQSNVGNVELAEKKLKVGMTKSEVVKTLGKPHEDSGGSWRYYDDCLLVGQVLLVRFGEDDRIVSTEWWLR